MNEQIHQDTDSAQRPDPGATRRRYGRVGIGVVVAAVVAVAAWQTRGDSAAEDADAGSTGAVNTAEVVAADLVETTRYSGFLGRASGPDLTVRRDGTITAVPEPGTTLDQGDVVVWIDNEPVVLLIGELPAWRTLDRGTEGPDVEQLEVALTALGFNDNETRMTVDEVYTGATAAVVEDWQASIGAAEDGVVGLGEVIFAPGPIRVDALQVGTGDVVSPGTPLFTTSSDGIEVTFGLPVEDQGKVQIGDPADITLPDGTVTTGVVTEVASVATSDPETGDTEFEVRVDLDDPSAAAGIDGAPVRVDVVTAGVDDVLAVPVEALLALAEGGYAVEVVVGEITRLVPVETGFFGDGMIEVAGEIVDGMEVVVP